MKKEIDFVCCFCGQPGADTQLVVILGWREQCVFAHESCLRSLLHEEAILHERAEG